MENQGAAGALQLNQEVDDECLGRHVSNPHSMISVKCSGSGRCGFIASGSHLEGEIRQMRGSGTWL